MGSFLFKKVIKISADIAALFLMLRGRKYDSDSIPQFILKIRTVDMFWFFIQIQGKKQQKIHKL